MAYATSTDVQGMIAKFTIGAASTPTSTQLTAMINGVAAEIDAHLAAVGVAVPVAAPSWFVIWLGHVNAYGAVAEAIKSMFPDAIGPGETPAYVFWEKRYQTALERIKSGSAIPPDATVGDASVSPSTYLTRNPDEEENLGDIAEPFFKVGTTF